MLEQAVKACEASLPLEHHRTMFVRYRNNNIVFGNLSTFFTNLLTESRCWHIIPSNDF